MCRNNLTGNYSEIPYNTYAINAYDSLHKGSDEPTIVYLHSVQGILEHIQHTSDMSSITGLTTNHAKLLTGLKGSKLQNKLAESIAKKWTTMAQVLQDIAYMVINFKRSCGYSLPTFKFQHVSSSNSSSSYRSNKPPPTKSVQQLST